MKMSNYYGDAWESMYFPHSPNQHGRMRPCNAVLYSNLLPEEFFLGKQTRPSYGKGREWVAGYEEVFLVCTNGGRNAGKKFNLSFLASHQNTKSPKPPVGAFQIFIFDIVASREEREKEILKAQAKGELGSLFPSFRQEILEEHPGIIAGVVREISPDFPEFAPSKIYDSPTVQNMWTVINSGDLARIYISLDDCEVIHWTI